MKTFAAFLLSIFSASAAKGRDLHVHPNAGSDAYDGIARPLQTIAQAIKHAQPGDTIHLAPVVYRESAVFHNQRGPITLDGHGATLDGSEPLDAAKWHEAAPGLFRCDALLPRLDAAILGRWFFLFDGRMQLMGRTSKGSGAPLKKPEDLQPGEWTFVRDESRKGAKVGDICGAFFIKLTPGQKLADANIALPLRSAGVQFSGDENADITLRNVTATHVYNDGFNIHGNGRNLVFENIAAIECGDDGFSAHEAAECRIDGFRSIGNSTGLCDTVSSITHYRNVFIKGCLGYDVFFIGDSAHTMENVLIESRAARTLEVAQHTDRPQNGISRVTLKNVLIRRVGGKAGDVRISRNARLTMERCTFLGVNFTLTPGGEVGLDRCVISGDPKPSVLLFPNTRWHGTNNLYDLATLRVDKTIFSAATFADFQKLTAADVGSRWAPLATKPLDIGADEVCLKPLSSP